MGGFCLLVELHREGSDLQPAQQACLLTHLSHEQKSLYESQVYLGATPNITFVWTTLENYM